MDRPPHSTPGSSTPNPARPVNGPPRSTQAGDTSDLPTLVPAATSSGISILNSTSLAVLGQRYEILGEAGRGAMGQVYKARDRETGEIVALKLLKPEIASDQEMVDRFKSELLFARKITHKNVCRVYEFNRIDGIAYTSMEFVEGENLRSVLNRFGSVTLRKGTDLALQMCSGLKEAHAQGIVHRDLKPENVMIDARGNLKIMDFGIARSMERLTLLTGAMTGTPAYMAPEQATGKPVDFRTDIYAFGLMLYEMFTGEQAFRAENAIALALKQLNESPKPPRQIEPSIPAPLEGAILKCLEKEPSQRFQSIAELETVLGSQSGPQADLAAKRSDALPNQATGRAQTAVVASGQSRPAKPVWKRAAIVATLILVGAFTALAGLIAWRGLPARHFSEVISPPPEKPALPSVHASAPPVVAAGTSGPAQPGAPQKPRKLQPHNPVEAKPASAPPANRAETAAVQTPGQKGNQPAATVAPSAVVPVQPGTAAAPGGASPAAAQNSSPFFVWVNRYPRTVGAQSAANKIEGMGLPVTVIPRHNPETNSDFFVVMTGPIAADKIDGVMEQLRAKGFANAHPVKSKAQAASSSGP